MPGRAADADSSTWDASYIFNLTMELQRKTNDDIGNGCDGYPPLVVEGGTVVWSGNGNSRGKSGVSTGICVGRCLTCGDDADRISGERGVIAGATARRFSYFVSVNDVRLVLPQTCLTRDFIVR
jgi:hypothetical protein